MAADGCHLWVACSWSLLTTTLTIAQLSIIPHLSARYLVYARYMRERRISSSVGLHPYHLSRGEWVVVYLGGLLEVWLFDINIFSMVTTGFTRYSFGEMLSVKRAGTTTKKFICKPSHPSFTDCTSVSLVNCMVGRQQRHSVSALRN